MKPEPFRIRRAGAHDVGPLLSMMRELAVFERYAEHFHVTAPELLRRGLAPPQARPEFIALVAEPALGVGLCAYAVLLLTPFTYDLRPTLTLKELYVSASHRRQGVAEAMLAAVKAHASDAGRRAHSLAGAARQRGRQAAVPPLGRPARPGVGELGDGLARVGLRRTVRGFSAPPSAA